MNFRTCCLLFGLTVVASASPVTVVNPSFETLPAGGLPFTCGTGCAYSIDAITGWTNSGNSGQFQPGTGQFNSLPPDGLPTVAYSNDVGGIISQSVGTVGAANVVYTLMVDLGLRKDCCDSLGTVQLMIGSTLVTATGTAPSVGNWSTFTATYTTLAADVGKTLTIDLKATGGQSDFDNVRLDATAIGTVPEPASLALFGLGLTFIGWKTRRKRA